MPITQKSRRGTLLDIELIVRHDGGEAERITCDTMTHTPPLPMIRSARIEDSLS